MIILLLLSYTLPIDAPVMPDIEYFQIRGLFDLPPLKPYDLDDVTPQLDRLLLGEYELSAAEKKILSHFDILLGKTTDFSTLFHLNGSYRREPNRGSGFLDYRLGGRLLDHLNYAQGIRLQASNEIDSVHLPYPWKKYVKAYLNEGLIKADFERFHFEAGRKNLFWGPGDEYGLLLSPDLQGYDGFFIRIPQKLYDFNSVFAVLDTRTARYLAVHRLGLNLKRIQLGFSESILWGNELEPIYLNFLFPYYLAQWGLHRDDNIMWNIDATVNFENMVFYAEFLIDDFQYGKPDGYVRFPNKLAFQAGIKKIIGRCFVAKLNYTFVDKWVYTQRIPVNAYEKNGQSLGYPLGNDADQWTLNCRFVNAIGLYPGLRVEYIRQGSGTISLPYETELGDPNPPFPSGVVQKTLNLMPGISYRLKRNFYLQVETGAAIIRNQSHVTGQDQTQFLLNAGGWMMF
jgi:hypothetical protein